MKSKGFGLIQVLIGLVILSMVIAAFAVLTVQANHLLQKNALKQKQIHYVVNQLEILRATPYSKIDSQTSLGIEVNQIQVGLKEITVTSGNVKMMTRRSNN